MKTNQIENTAWVAGFGKSMATVVGLALAFGLMPAAHAQAAQVSNSEVGHSTQAWLELQRSNAQAAPTQPMLGAEAGYAWQRYMKSFETEIPASFGSSVITGGSQGGGTGGLSSGGSN
jgi:hypothetical protein